MLSISYTCFYSCTAHVSLCMCILCTNDCAHILYAVPGKCIVQQEQHLTHIHHKTTSDEALWESAPWPLPALQYLLKSTDYGPSVDWQGSANQSLAVVTRGQRGIHLASTHQSFECHDCWQLFLIEQKLNYSFMSGFYFSSGQTGLSAYKLTLSSVMFTKNPLLLALLLIRTIWLEIRSHKNINMINVHFIIQPKINKANRGSMG